jgi:hypothetical protein
LIQPCFSVKNLDIFSVIDDVMRKRNVRRSEKIERKEDATDLQAIRERASEPTTSFKTVLKSLRKSGLLS